jgi:hypothetical protein
MLDTYGSGFGLRHAGHFGHRAATVRDGRATFSLFTAFIIALLPIRQVPPPIF